MEFIKADGEKINLDLSNPFQVADIWRDMLIYQAHNNNIPIDESVIAKSTVVLLDEIDRHAAFATAVIKAIEYYKEHIFDDETLV